MSYLGYVRCQSRVYTLHLKNREHCEAGVINQRLIAIGLYLKWFEETEQVDGATDWDPYHWSRFAIV